MRYSTSILERSGRARGADCNDRGSRVPERDDGKRVIDAACSIVAEYKRRQAAPGVKVTQKNFGRDRRYPITNRFRDNGKALPAPDDKLVVRAGRASAEAFEG